MYKKIIKRKKGYKLSTNTIAQASINYFRNSTNLDSSNNFDVVYFVLTV